MHWTEIENALQARAESVCQLLFPNGKREGAEWVVGSLAGEAGNSLKINLAGKIGVWRDFAGDKGGKTLLELWLRARNLNKFGLAVVEAKQWLGLADDFPRDRIHPAALPAPKPKPDESGWEAVAKTWARCEPLTEGGPVWQYLVEQRRIEPQVLTAYDVREYLTHGQWAMVFPYYAAAQPDSTIVTLKKDPAPAWLKFELVPRRNGKKEEWTSRAPEKSLFGVQLDAAEMFRGCRHVLICEGEKDALTWASYGCSAWSVLPVSVPFGAKWKGQDNRPSPNREWLDRCWDWLDNFESVLVQMDGDEAGQRAAADIINEIGPRRCRLVTLPVKEATT